LLSSVCQAGWKRTTISKGGEFHGVSNTIAIDPVSGYPHITYIDDSVGGGDYVLKHSFFDGSSWITEWIDPAPGPFSPDMVIDKSGHIHISYGGGSPYKFRYAYYDGSTWHAFLVDDEGYCSSITVDADSHPHISFILGGSGLGDTLKYARYDGNQWVIQTITTNALYLYRPSIVLTSSGKAYISFCGYNGQDWERRIFSATNISGDWVVSYVDDNGGSSSVALDSLDNPHIAYIRNWELRYTHYDGSAWITEILGPKGESPSLVIDSSNHPHITYNSRHSDQDYIDQLKYIYFDGEAWRSEIIDPKNTFGSSLALDPLGNLHVVYTQDNIKKEAYTLPIFMKYAYLLRPDMDGDWVKITMKKISGKYTLKGQLTINNNGAGATGKFIITFYLSEDNVYDGGDLPIGESKKVSNVSPGRSKTIAFTYKSTDPLSGKYLIAVIDSADTVNETEEDNNVAIIAIP
jgi:hypothetical protein